MSRGETGRPDDHCSMAVVLQHLHQRTRCEAKRCHAAAEMRATVKFAHDPRLARLQFIELRYTCLECRWLVFANLAENQVSQALVIKGRAGIDDLPVRVC